MGRLIDTDDLEDFIINNGCVVGDNGNLLVDRNGRWELLLPKIPTAYDTNKVVEELEELQNYACFPSVPVSSGQEEVYSYFRNELTRILDLMSKGGVSDAGH